MDADFFEDGKRGSLATVIDRRYSADMVDVKELKAVLGENLGKRVQLVLPGGEAVPQHFHVTEIGGVRKDFIDCGGTQRVSSCCLIQCWVATDVEHRIVAEKFLGILNLGKKVLAGDFLPVEVEYEEGVISQYPLKEIEVTYEAVVLRLMTKHTDCLAKEKCGIPEAEEDC
ncbi:MAG: DUF6428 family protein [Verrucomicrobiaceae bacterium]